MQTIESFIEKETDNHPQSLLLDFHNKAEGHERRIATYLAENVRMATGIEVSQSPDTQRRDYPTNRHRDTYLPHAAHSIRSHDLCIPRLASPVG